MAECSQERAGTSYHQRIAIVGILKHIAANLTLTGKVKFISISVKEVEETLNIKIDMNTRIRIGKFLSEAPFKVSKSKSGGYAKYVLDVEELYNYVRNYNVDISSLADDELDKLEKVTGLNWKSIGFNKDEWVKTIVSKLFGENSGDASQQLSTHSTLSTASAEQRGSIMRQSKAQIIA